MNDIQILIEGLRSHDNNFAYKCLLELQQESEKSSAVYQYFDLFAEMLDDDSSYIRTRGFVLIASNAKWDVDFKVDEIIDRLLKHITDYKPIAARQCIKALPMVAKHKPELKPDIIRALRGADVSGYKDSMRPLLEQDIKKSLTDIEKF